MNHVHANQTTATYVLEKNNSNSYLLRQSFHGELILKLQLSAMAAAIYQTEKKTVNFRAMIWTDTDVKFQRLLLPNNFIANNMVTLLHTGNRSTMHIVDRKAWNSTEGAKNCFIGRIYYIIFFWDTKGIIMIRFLQKRNMIYGAQ